MLRFLAGFLCLLWCVSLFAGSSFEKTVEPFLKTNCFLCHNAKAKVGGLNLEQYPNSQAALKDRDVWEKVLQKMRTGQMPPKGGPVPSPEQVAVVTRWFEVQFARLDRNMKPDSGRITARRLNRVEYNNTIRDLL